ncbi:TetR/AcrR family transcriptional regulator [Roseovarius sp. C7]|uniref:TetR/AcrR family transcriptional regulator n=1 Tax=Roseovarius sp. C7 TaxID=3398643 RepID=UPI0039F469F3
MTTARATRLTRNDWLEAGRDTLATTGPAALKAEALARQIGTTKGSFYWHFRDLPQFQQALIAGWEEAALTALIEAETEPTPAAALLHMAQGINAGRRLENALRAWALSYPPAAETVARVDAARLGRITAHLAAIGVTNPDMAHVLRAAMQGLAALDSPERAQTALSSLVDLILALR